MIATVRIAPIEQWCEECKAMPRTKNFRPGQIVFIETDSMKQSKYHKEPTRIWHGPAGKEFGWICEHMLEMD